MGVQIAEVQMGIASLGFSCRAYLSISSSSGREGKTKSRYVAAARFSHALAVSGSFCCEANQAR